MKFDGIWKAICLWWNGRRAFRHASGAGALVRGAVRRPPRLRSTNRAPRDFRRASGAFALVHSTGPRILQRVVRQGIPWTVGRAAVCRSAKAARFQCLAPSGTFPPFSGTPDKPPTICQIACVFLGNYNGWRHAAPQAAATARLCANERSNSGVSRARRPFITLDRVAGRPLTFCYISLSLDNVEKSVLPFWKAYV